MNTGAERRPVRIRTLRRHRPPRPRPLHPLHRRPTSRTTTRRNRSNPHHPPTPSPHRTTRGTHMTPNQKGTTMSGIIRQGDVLVIPATMPPKNTTAKVKRERGRLILAHGEATGHAHAIVEATAEMLVSKDQAADLYLLVHGTEPVSLVHDEHDTLTIAPGTYKVVRQREYSPEGLRNVAD